MVEGAAAVPSERLWKDIVLCVRGVGACGRGRLTHRAVPLQVPDDAGEDGAAALHRRQVPPALARLRVVGQVLEVRAAAVAAPVHTAVPVRSCSWTSLRVQSFEIWSELL